MKKSQKGFTLVELIVVIVILGILAATALPRFVNIQGDARVAVIQGVAASMESAKSLVRGKWMAAGDTALATITTSDNQSVATYTGTGQFSGYPTGAGIVNAIIYPAASVTCATAGQNQVCNYTGFANCAVTYFGSNGAATDGSVSLASAVAANCGG